MRITIEKCRETMWKAFQKDKDFADLYKAQIACFIMDNFPGYKRDNKKRNKLANILFKTLYKN